MNATPKGWAIRAAALVGVVYLALSCGCVHPGRLDPTIVARYQQAMAEKGPQDRRADHVLGELLPAEGVTGPALTVHEDDQGRQTIRLGLQEAIMRGLSNNLDIRVISYAPQISREEMMQAAARFDYVFFGDLSMAKTDEFLTLSGARNDRRTRGFEVGLRQTTITGAEWSVSYELLKDHNRSTSPNSKSWDPTLSASLTQPLLRGGWAQRNLAELRVARISHDVSIAIFRQQVEQTITEIVTAYWQLVQARRDVEIQQALLVATEKTLERILSRKGIDATAVQVKQTQAAVEQRRAALIRARKLVGDAQDILGRLMADAQINTLVDVEIVPTDRPSEAEVLIDQADQLLTALKFNPRLEQARLAIAAADIDVKVAQNERLPQLDLSVTGAVDGRGESLHDAVDEFNSMDQVSWSIELAFEVPLGNRQRKALLRQRQHEKLRTVTEMQDRADEVAQRVRERVREARTAYQEIVVEKLAVDAARAQLQALEDTERIRGALTPEFLQVKLAAQETLAAAGRSLIQSVVSYNVALAEVNQATGTALEMHQVKLALPVAEDLAPWPLIE